MHRWISLLLVGSLALACGSLPRRHRNPAVSHDPAAAHAQTDSNRDGLVDMEEFHQRIVEVYFHGDRDKDGTMSYEEIDGVVVFQEDWTLVDSNEDGRISLHEFVRDRMQDFHEVDGDGNGLLSKQEVVDAYGEAQP